MKTDSPWLWDVPDYLAAKGSPGQPADIPVVRTSKERRRKLARPHRGRTMAPRMPQPGCSPPRESRPGMPDVTAFS